MSQAIEKHCRTENGYTGLKDVSSANPPKDDVQQVSMQIHIHQIYSYTHPSMLYHKTYNVCIWVLGL